MLAEFLEHGRRGALEAALAAAGPLLGQQHHGAVDADREHLLHRRQVGVGAVVQDERPVAAEARRDRLAGLGMHADLARQRQQLQRVLQVDAVGVDALGDRGALGLLLLGAFAELHVGPEAAGAQRDGEAGLGIVAEQLAVGRGGFRRAVGRLRELARDSGNRDSASSR